MLSQRVILIFQKSQIEAIFAIFKLHVSNVISTRNLNFLKVSKLSVEEMEQNHVA